MRTHVLFSFFLRFALLVGGAPANATELSTISKIQGSGHTSEFDRQTVKIGGVVTNKDDKNFFLQDPVGDGNDATSEGIFVKVNGESTAPPVTIGMTVEVEGVLDENRQFGAELALTQTQLKAAVVNQIGATQALTPTIIGRTGRLSPTEIVDDDGLTSFDPSSDGIDFWESLEGMLVRANDAIVVGPSMGKSQAWIVADGGANATGMNSSGGITVAPGDFNPELIRIQFPENSPPNLKMGDRVAFVEGTVRYQDNGYEILVTRRGDIAPSTQSPGRAPDRTANHLTIASFNAKNLDLINERPERVPAKRDVDNDVADGQFAEIARQVVQVLSSPDIIGFQEFQDNDGGEFSDVVSADATATQLIQDIKTAGGPQYSFVEKAPVDDSSGGQPGGNIRVVFLYNSERVIVDESSVQSVEGQAFAHSRLPLSAIFKFAGKRIRVTNVHLESKIGDDPLFGSRQPPTSLSDQARIIKFKPSNSICGLVRRMRSTSSSCLATSTPITMKCPS